MTELIAQLLSLTETCIVLLFRNKPCLLKLFLEVYMTNWIG